MIRNLPAVLALAPLLLLSESVCARTFGGVEHNRTATIHQYSEHSVGVQSTEVKTTFVVSDKAAKTAIEIIWSVTDSLSRSAKKNQIENEEAPVAHDGVEIENVEDLDVRSLNKFNRRRMDSEQR